jgi:tetratricopeptide (TPR) repeat protein
MGGAAAPVGGFFAAAAIPARYALERGAWPEAAALEVRPSSFAHADAITHFARALGAARSGNPAAAKADVERLAALRDKLVEMKDAYWSEQVDIQRRVALAWIAYAEGKRDDGIRMLREAADAEDATDKAAITPGPLAPARELLGEMLLESGNAKDALVAFEATMKKEPGRFRGAYGAARAAEAAGDRARARDHYQRVLEIAASADSSLRRAISTVAHLNGDRARAHDRRVRIFRTGSSRRKESRDVVGRDYRRRGGAMAGGGCPGTFRRVDSRRRKGGRVL